MTDLNRPYGQQSGHASDSDAVVTRSEEIVVQTRWVARERVRLSTHSVTEDREISEDLRREQLEINETTHGG
jgi:stress response protein YsnF